MYNARQYREAMRLLASGLSDRDVSDATGVPRPTIGYWRRRPRVRPAPPHPDEWSVTDSDVYSYLLGLYLGDGCVLTPRRGSLVLVITLDRTYPDIVEEAAAAAARVFAGRGVSVYERPERGTAVVQVSHPAMVRAFPQHGRGRKHKRPIHLADWQRKITSEYPRELIRGLIHSDGSRVVNRFSTRLPSGRVAECAYPRYFFTNYSEDIREIFREHCELLGIRCTQSSFKNMSVSHRDSVAILDTFVGPKS